MLVQERDAVMSAQHGGFPLVGTRKVQVVDTLRAAEPNKKSPEISIRYTSTSAGPLFPYTHHAIKGSLGLVMGKSEGGTGSKMPSVTYLRPREGW